MSTAPIPSLPVRVGRRAHHGRDQHDVRLAWACVVAAPVVLVVAFGVGEGLGGVLGAAGTGGVSTGVALVVLLVAGVLLAVPTLLAVHFARRAHAVGDDRARVPAVLLVVLTAGFLVLNVVSYAAMLLLN